MKLLLFSALLLYLQQSDAQVPDTITSARAKDFIGKNITLCDRVNYGRYLNINKDGPVRLFVGPDYPDHNLTLIFPDDVLLRFSFDPEKKMINKRFCVVGTITIYRKKPAIFVTSESQINAEE